MTTVYADASCGPLGVAWGGVFIGPAGALATHAEVLADFPLRHPHASLLAELRGLVAAVRAALHVWSDQRVVLYGDCETAVRSVQHALNERRALWDDWSDRLFAGIRRQVICARWMPRETHEIQLCDALSRVAIADSRKTMTRARRAGVRQSMLMRLAALLHDPTTRERNAAEQGALRALHRTQRLRERQPPGWPTLNLHP